MHERVESPKAEALASRVDTGRGLAIRRTALGLMRAGFLGFVGTEVMGAVLLLGDMHGSPKIGGRDHLHFSKTRSFLFLAQSLLIRWIIARSCISPSRLDLLTGCNP